MKLTMVAFLTVQCKDKSPLLHTMEEWITMRKEQSAFNLETDFWNGIESIPTLQGYLTDYLFQFGESDATVCCRGTNWAGHA